MNENELRAKLNQLRNLPSENEVFEFKEAKNQYNFQKIGKYFSALSNEANLRGYSSAWLVFGVRDNDRAIVGSKFREKRENLDSLKGEIAQKTSNNITFFEIYELYENELRVVMFEIPPAIKGIPTSWEGHWFARNGQELVSMSIDKLDRIRTQTRNEDWSARIVEGASLLDLDPAAIGLARKNYLTKYPDKANEIQNWNNQTFLNKAKILIKGKITNTAILLLGKEESEHFISPSVAKIRWILKDQNGIEKDYQIFSCPFLLKINEAFSKIRNLKYRYIKDETLFPEEVLQYEPYVIREALNNCIAHQDYELNGRINVIEMDDSLIFSNLGGFIPGSVDNVIQSDAPEMLYRNQFLSTAMLNLNLVDTIGSGIRKMYFFQKNRFFPLPEYQIEPQKVAVTITGKVLDIEYARTLARNPDLTLNEIISLDKVQKKKILSNAEAQYLKKKKLIEGRKPNYFIAKKMAELTKEKAKYIKNRAFDDEHYKKMVLSLIQKYGQATRSEIDDLLLDKLSDVLTHKQKRTKIRNLLYSMHKNDKSIEYFGSGTRSIWKEKNRYN